MILFTALNDSIFSLPLSLPLSLCVSLSLSLSFDDFPRSWSFSRAYFGLKRIYNSLMRCIISVSNLCERVFVVLCTQEHTTHTKYINPQFWLLLFCSRSRSIVCCSLCFSYSLVIFLSVFPLRFSRSYPNCLSTIRSSQQPLSLFFSLHLSSSVPLAVCFGSIVVIVVFVAFWAYVLNSIYFIFNGKRLNMA